MSVVKHASERFTLYCADAADAIDLIESKSVGLIATDPPYGVKWQSSFRKPGARMARIENDEGGYDSLALIGAYVGSVLMDYRHVYAFGTTAEAARERLPLGGSCDLIWDKGMVGLGDLSLPWGPQHENIMFGVYVPSKVARANNRGALSARLRAGSVLSVQRPNSGGVKRHPTEKPVELMRRLVESSSSPDDTVLDMFAGSGSTLVAAVLCGRRAIGVEITREYFDIAVERCAKAEALWKAGLAA